MEENYRYHMFMPQETVRAILRKYNKYESDPTILEKLTKMFYELNGNKVFKPGMKVKIPILK